MNVPLSGWVNSTQGVRTSIPLEPDERPKLAGKFVAVVLPDTCQAVFQPRQMVF
jgi:hypothetical protein